MPCLADTDSLHDIRKKITFCCCIIKREDVIVHDLRMAKTERKTRGAFVVLCALIDGRLTEKSGNKETVADSLLFPALVDISVKNTEKVYEE